jgi:hypothetical protein
MQITHGFTHYARIVDFSIRKCEVEFEKSTFAKNGDENDKALSLKNLLLTRARMM